MLPPAATPEQVDPVAAAADADPSAPALITAEGAITYAALEQLVAQGVGALLARGVGEGDRVGVAATPTVETVAMLWACPRVGAVPVPVPVADSPRRVATLSAADAAVFVGPDIDGVPSLHPSSVREATPVHQPGFDVTAPQLVCFTSGTSGEPRGVVLTGQNLVAHAAASADRLATSADDRWLAVLPLHHVGGLAVLWRMALAGGAVVLGPWSAARRLVPQATVASLVPTMLRRALVGDVSLASLRFVLLGGGPIDGALLADADSAGVAVLPTYGMTEMASQAATRPVQHPGPEPWVGPPLTGAEISIVGGEGGEVPAGTVGDILVRGPMLSPGAIGEPGREPDGWHRSGDVGCLDDRGWLRVVGRADDVIVTGGENVHPAPVEAALRNAPGVVDAVVVGLPDPEWGRAVVAGIVGDAKSDALAASVREVLDDVHVPRAFVRIHEVPRSAMGKVDRLAARQAIIEARSG